MLVSVITVCRNSESTISSTIESVLSQSYASIEYLIIDGASGDQTLEIIERYRAASDKNIRVISEPDDGIYDAMNKGLRLATGDLICFMNSDDRFCKENVVSEVVDILEKCDAEVIFGNARLIENGELAEVKKHEGVNAAYFLRNTINHQSIFAKKQVFDHVGGFDTQYSIKADYDWELRCYFTGGIRFRYVDIDVCDFQCGGHSSDWARNNAEMIKIIYCHYRLPVAFLANMVLCLYWKVASRFGKR